MRRDGNLPEPELAPGSGLKERAAMLAIAASHPVWMVERWAQRYGEAETVKLLAANNRRELRLTMHHWPTSYSVLSCIDECKEQAAMLATIRSPLVPC